MSERRIHRAYHPAPGTTGDRVTLSREESLHLARVLRARPGQPITIFDGRGTEYAAVLETVSGSTVEVTLAERLRGSADPALAVTIFQALCRPERIEWMIQKATEVGVAAIRLVRTRRVDAGRRSSGKVERWTRIALEASKQCGRRTVPEVSEAGELPARLPGGVSGWLLHDSETALPAGVCVQGPVPAALWIAVGPEGGFEPEEVADRAASGWATVSLGPRTLRAETAGIVAATLALSAWGDLGRRSQGGPPG